MEQSEINKRNEAIAKFMGLTFNTTFEGLLPNHWIDKNSEVVGSYLDTTLKYNSSWDWLMPVVQKMLENGCWTHQIDYAITKININALFEAVSNVCLDAQSYSTLNN